MADKPKKIIPDADYKRLMPKFRAHVISESAAKRLNLGSKPEKPAESKPAPKKAAATNAPIQISVGKRGAKKWRKGNGPWQYGEPPKPDKKQISTEEKKDMAELRKAQAGHEKALRTADPAHAARLRTIAEGNRRLLESDPPKKKASAEMKDPVLRKDHSEPPKDSVKGSASKGSSSGLMAKMKVTKQTPSEDGKGTIGSKPTIDPTHRALRSPVVDGNTTFTHVGPSSNPALGAFALHGTRARPGYGAGYAVEKTLFLERTDAAGRADRALLEKHHPGFLKEHNIIDPIAAAKLKEVPGSFVVGDKPHPAVSSLMNKLNATRPAPNPAAVEKAIAHVEHYGKQFKEKTRIEPYRSGDGVMTHAAIDPIDGTKVHLGHDRWGSLMVNQQR